MATNKEAADSLLAAIKNLNAAYKAANTADDKDEIFSTMEILQDELNQMGVQGLTANDGQYAALTSAFKGYAQQLQQVKNDIDKLVKYVQLAADVVSSLEKVATLLA